MPIFGALLTILWIVGVMNAMNLIDGLDGLAGGVALIAALSIFLAAHAHGSPLIALWNQPPGGRNMCENTQGSARRDLRHCRLSGVCVDSSKSVLLLSCSPELNRRFAQLKWGRS
jgi:hypothetical protein